MRTPTIEIFVLWGLISFTACSESSSEKENAQKEDNFSIEGSFGETKVEFSISSFEPLNSVPDESKFFLLDSYIKDSDTFKFKDLPIDNWSRHQIIWICDEKMGSASFMKDEISYSGYCSGLIGTIDSQNNFDIDQTEGPMKISKYFSLNLNNHYVIHSENIQIILKSISPSTDQALEFVNELEYIKQMDKAFYSHSYEKSIWMKEEFWW